MSYLYSSLHNYGYILFFPILLYLGFSNPSAVFASCLGGLPAIRQASIQSTACSIAGLDGVDHAQNDEASVINSGSLTITGGSSLTINASATLLVGQLSLVNGTIAIATGGIIQTGKALYVRDEDADGWPADLTLYAASASGRRRLGLMRSFTTNDCNDTPGNFSIGNMCCTAQTWYRDADGDGYGNPTVTISECQQPTGYVANNTDCYDANAQAYPQSPFCATIHRGDGSFDYNCSLSASKCGLTYYSLRTAQTCDFKCGQGNAKCCAVGTVTLINTSVACGVGGYLRVGTSYNHGNCGSPCTQSTGYSYGASGTQGCQ
jgi:hypothetical protein